MLAWIVVKESSPPREAHRFVQTVHQARKSIEMVVLCAIYAVLAPPLRKQVLKKLKATVSSAHEVSTLVQASLCVRVVHQEATSLEQGALAAISAQLARRRSWSSRPAPVCASTVPRDVLQRRRAWAHV